MSTQPPDMYQGGRDGPMILDPDYRNKRNKRGNRAWGNRKVYEAELRNKKPVDVTRFEEIVLQFKLKPEQYVRSIRLRHWAIANRNAVFIPENLLKAWKLEVKGYEGE